VWIFPRVVSVTFTTPIFTISLSQGSHLLWSQVKCVIKEILIFCCFTVGVIAARA
jgi:hypothetical protein